MKRTLFIILLLNFKVYSQDIIGKWNVFSYEDEIAYYNKAKDSISYKNSAKKDEAESFKQMSDLIIFSVTYNFKSDGKYILNFTALGETANGDFKIDELNKIIVMTDDKGKKDELNYTFENKILFVGIKMETGFIKLGLTKVSN